MPRRVFGLAAALALTSVYSSPGIRHLGYLPTRVTLEAGQTDVVGPPLPAGLTARVSGSAAKAGTRVLDMDGRPVGRKWAPVAPGPARLFVARAGRYPIEIGALGIPLRSIDVQAVQTPVVVAGGDSIGIRVKTAGVLVMGGPALTAPRSLLRWSGLRAGDRIVGVDGAAVGNVGDLRRAVDRAGRYRQPVALRVVRQGETLRFRVRPALDRNAGRYRLGIRVREGLTGIGTLTLYDPRTRRFAALGHRVEDGMTGQSLPVVTGAVRPSAILGIERGVMGRPGEKIGILTSGTDLGQVTGGGHYGIYGYLRMPPHGPRLPVATVDEVHPGPATIRTVVGGSHVEAFRIRIERVDKRAPGGRALVIRVTDPRLVAAAGGIVQGMSGSPIIQDGRLAGAVTHVLVSDSLRGYGVFALWMWEEALAETAHEAQGHGPAAPTRQDSTLRAG